MRTKLVFQVLIAAMVASLLAYLINQLPAVPDFPYKNHIIVGAVVAVTLLAAVIALWQKKHSDEQTAITDLPQQTARPRFQAKLLESVKEEVSTRLNQSLHNRVLIDLDKQIQPEQVQRPWDAEIKIGSKPAELLPPETEILSVFDRDGIKGKLLILGEPGSGKTTTLLDLADALVKEAENNPAAPIPVLVNLSTWKDSKQAMPEWLVEELNSKYGVPKNLGNEWLINKQLLPLLDGLDEVKPEYQRFCVQAINQWLNSETRPSSIAICCRREEYETVVREHWEEANHQLEPEMRLQLNGAILLQPLTNQQIQHYLFLTEESDSWQAIQQDLALLELIRTPLFLSITLLSYKALPINEWQKLITTENRIEILLDAYIEQMLSRNIKIDTKGNNYFSKTYKKQNFPDRKQTRGWLIWLSKLMKSEFQDEFLIESLQPSCLSKRKYELFKVSYILLYILPILSFITIIYYLIHFRPLVESSRLFNPSTSWSQIFWREFGSIIGGGSIIIMILTGGFHKILEGKIPEIRFFERLKWSFEAAWLGVVKYFNLTIRHISAYIFLSVVLFVVMFIIDPYEFSFLLKSGIKRPHCYENLAFEWPINEAICVLESTNNSIQSLVYSSVNAYAIAGVLACLLAMSLLGIIKSVWIKKKGSIGEKWSVLLDFNLPVLFLARATFYWILLSVTVSFLAHLFLGIILTWAYKAYFFFLNVDLNRLFDYAFARLFPIIFGFILLYVLIALVWGAVLGFQSNELIEKAEANQAVWNTLHYSLRLPIILGILFALGLAGIMFVTWATQGVISNLKMDSYSLSVTATLANSAKSGFISGLFFGLIVSYSNGIKSCIQHATLRGILCWAGCAPWNYARFLDYCTERMLLQRVGGRYRFIHKSLQEHFSSMSK